MACFISAAPFGATLRLAQRGSPLPLHTAATRLPRTVSIHRPNPDRHIGRSAAAWPVAAGPLRAGPAAAAAPPSQTQRQRQPHLLSRSSLLRAGVLALGGGSAFLAGDPSGAARGPISAAAAAMSTSAAAATAAAVSSPSGAIVVYVTVPSAEVGEALASKLVESQLAACVNMLPGVTSIYTWKGKVEKDTELLLIIKSRGELLPELTAFVRSNHPYEEPEVVALPILGGSPSYLQWLMDNTRGPAAAGAGAADMA